MYSGEALADHNRQYGSSLSSNTLHFFLMFMTQLLKQLPREILPAASRKAGKRIESAFVIVDLKGFG
jgi:hypothetical protein